METVTFKIRGQIVSRQVASLYFVAIGVFVCPPSAPLRSQTLNEVRSEIHSPSASASANQRTTYHRSNQEAAHESMAYMDSEEDQTWGQMLGELGWNFAVGFTYATFVGDPSNRGYDITYKSSDSAAMDTPATMYFAHYPYADGLNGYAMQSDHVPARPLTSAMQYQIAFGSDFDSVQWYTAKGFFEWSRSRFGVDTEWTYFHENLQDGTSDELHLGDINLLWRRLQTRRWLVRWGLGTGWSHDREGTAFGINSTVKVDYFPSEPWVISGEYDLGRLGHATAQHLRLGIGATWKHFELFSAYDYRRFGDVEISGPIFGLRLWW